MAALSADINIETVGAIERRSFSANAVDVFYQGAIVYIDTGGGAQCTAAAGDRAVGVCLTRQTIGAIGDLVHVMTHGDIWVPLGTNIAAEDENDILVNDGPTDTDNFADMVSHDDITLAANDAAIGRILKVEAARMLVRIGTVTGQIIVNFATTPAVQVWM